MTFANRTRGRRIPVVAAALSAVLAAGTLALAPEPEAAAASGGSPQVTQRQDGVPAPVFTIGAADQSDQDFALAPGSYKDYPKAFPSDVDYTVGRNTPADWPYVQPGPDDAWAGNKAHPFTVHYRLTSDQVRDQMLRIDLLDTQKSPSVRVASNGRDLATASAPQGNGAGVYGLSDASGTTSAMTHPRQMGFVVPKQDLHVGDNTLTLTNVKGSWSVYDALSLAPAPDRLGPVHVLATEPTPLFVRDHGSDRQLVDVSVDNTAAAGPATLTATVGGKQTATRIDTLPAGRSTQRIKVPPTAYPGPGRLDIRADLGGDSATYPFSLPYQRRWQIDMVAGSHLDIGYHYDQDTTRQLQDAYLDQAVAQCRATADYPDAARFRWTIEQSWMVENYLKDRSPADIDKFKGCLKSGQLEMTAGHNNNLQDLASTEQLTRSLYQGTRTFPDKLGATVDTAVQDDISGVSAQYIQMLSQQGIKLLLNGTNPDHTTRWSIPHTTQDAPALFNWQAPDGSKVLTYFGANSYNEGYYVAPDLKCKLAPWPSGDSCRTDKGESDNPLPYTPVPPPAHPESFVPGLASGVANQLAGLQASRYPQSVYPMMFAQDSNPPMSGISDVVRSFNQTYSWPKLVQSTSSRYQKDATTRHGRTSPSGYRPDPTSRDVDQLPVKKGDYTDWWSDGAGSSSAETGETMRAQSRTTAAEKLATLASGPKATTPCRIDEAYAQADLYTEHTWASPSLMENDPQWTVKKSRADRASALSTKALRCAVHAMGQSIDGPAKTPGIAVLNSQSWERTDIATATVPGHWNGRLVDTSTGRQVPYQHTGARTIRFEAAQVPALGYRTYALEAGKNTAAAPDPDLRWDQNTGTLENSYYRVKISPRSGAVTSVYDKSEQRELVDATSPFRLNQYVYRPNPARNNATTPDRQWSPSDARISVAEHGPLSITIKITYPATPGGTDADGKATGVESAGATLTLDANTRRLDIADTIDKTKVSTPEEGYFAFPFKQDNPTVTYGGTGGPVALVDGQAPGAAMDWQAVRGYADVSGPGGGATLSTSDTPLMEFDHIRSMELTGRPGRLDTADDHPDLDSVRPKNGSVFSYAFNNLWGTNYRQSQDGPITYHYTVSNHRGGFDAAAATHTGESTGDPLRSVSLAAGHKGGCPQGNHSLLSLDAPGTIVQTVKPAYRYGNSSEARLPLTIRLQEVAGTDGPVKLHLPYAVSAAQLENLTEEPRRGGQLSVRRDGHGSVVTVPVHANAIVTLGLRPSAD
ncbi:glycoside hydrolase family 38 N-terminal domain-containing protein [Streptomyces avermitilis]